MTRRLKVIALALLAVCSLGAASAAGAQAAAHWTVAGSSLTGTAALAETVTLTGKTKLAVPILSLTIECTALKAKGGQIDSTNKGSIKALNFTGCTVASPFSKCQVHSAGEPAGTILTELVDLEVATVSGATYIYFTPAGTDIAEVVVEKMTGTTCALSGFYAVHGTMSMKVPTGTNAVSLPVESSETLQKASTSHIFFGSQTQESYLYILGGFALTGGQTWGVGL